ncbi:SusD/RagB family nutrient-binding outer membrane lipoprotein, partial [bacterium]|nr:SusD/RagB family nutrient-binding outer membrane lipoprotein [bacterium]
MKTIRNIKVISLAAVLMILGSCTKDFEEMNVNPNAATVVPATNVLLRTIMSTTYTLFGERLDVYYAGSYAGHTAATGLGDYEYRVDINNSMWRSMYIAMTYAVDAMRLAEIEGNTNLYAAALTLKAYTAQQTTDMWGDIPYSEAFRLDEEIIYPKYDSQKEVYTTILAELKEAAGLFSADGGDLGVGDQLLNGNIDMWMKFNNSIRLRVAIRMSTVDEAGATSIMAELAGKPLLTNNSENAYFWYPGTTPDQEIWFERMGAADGNKTDQYRTNFEMVSRLKDNNDPRLPVYVDLNRAGEYNGYRFFDGQTKDELNNDVSHIGDRFGNDPTGFSPWMNCAEVYFNLAEFYERGIATGDAKAAYEMGIMMSMEENGIEADAVETYMMEPNVAWGAGSMSNLEKIRTQKWISLFKQSVEAWSEARRT